jgi:hypothetical protein
MVLLNLMLRSSQNKSKYRQSVLVPDNITGYHNESKVTKALNVTIKNILFDDVKLQKMQNLVKAANG